MTAAIETTFTMCPPRPHTMCGRAACVHRKVPRRLTSTSSHQAPGLISPSGPTAPLWPPLLLPALFTSTSTRPKRSRAVATNSPTDCGSVAARAGGNRLAAAPAHLARHVLDLADRPRSQYEPGPGAGEGEGDRPADPAARPRDQADPAGQWPRRDFAGRRCTHARGPVAGRVSTS